MGNQDKGKKRQRVSSSDAKAETNEEAMNSQDGALISLTVTEYQVLIAKITSLNKFNTVPVELRSNVVYKFTCVSCNSCYVGETSRHLSTRIREHLNRDRTSHIFQHLQQSEGCRSCCSAECFKVIDHATTKFQVKIKEALHISWEQPSLNKQLYHVNLTLSF